MNSLINDSGYIQLSNDRSHLNDQVLKIKTPIEKPILDIYDVVIVAFNFLIVAYIVFNYFKYKKQAQYGQNQEINIVFTDKSVQFPFFQVFRKKPKSQNPKKVDQKQPLLMTGQNQNPSSSHNIVELKCTKCSYTTEIYEKNIISGI